MAVTAYRPSIVAQLRYPRIVARGGAGFTLIELIVVIVIIGIVVAGSLLSLSTAGRDSQLEQERDRLAALIDYVRERAGLQTVEYGLRCEQGGYRFIMYDTRKALWVEDPLDDALRPRALPAGLSLAVNIEGRDIVLPKPVTTTKNQSPTKNVTAPVLTPQVMLFSSGDISRFSLTLLRTGTGHSAVITGTSAGKIDIHPMVEKPT